MPTTTGLATDFITFTRTSNATVTDSNGFIKWAGHNLLTNSESFDASAWVKSSATVTTNTDPAPNGTTTGDTIAASGANGTALQTWTAEAVPYTFGVWLRRKTGTGNIQIAADSGTYTTVTITSSWALYTVTQTPATGSKSAGICIVTSGDEVYAWGAHLYRSDLGGMVLNPARGDAYYPTTPRNLLGYTESLTTGWTNTNTTDSIVTETNPNGLASSVEVTATAGNGTLLGSISLLASPYTFSIWLKRKTGTGTVEITVDGTTYVAAAVTGTWTRFSTTLTPTAGTKTPGIRLVTSGDAVFAWGAQLSDSASLDAYSPVYDAAVTSAAYYAPRLDYSGSSLAALGLLVEEQRGNLLLHTADFTQSAWTKFQLNTSGTPAWADVAIAPDGTQTAEKLIANTTTNAHWVGGSATITNGLAYTVSAYVKAGADAGDYSQALLYDCNISVYIIVNLTNGALISATATNYAITPVGNGWYRLSVTSTAASTTGYSRVYICEGGTTNFAGNDAKGIYAWGFQMEQGSFATSYIPNGSAIAGATRTADVASVSTQAFPYSASASTLVANISLLSVNTAGFKGLAAISDGTANNRIALYQAASATSAWQIVSSGGGPAQANITPGNVSANTPFKLGTAVASNDAAAYLGGVAGTPDTTVTMPAAATIMYIGGNASGGEPLNGWVRQITYLPRRLANADLAARTV